MAQTLVQFFNHIVFSTKHRAGLILPDLEPQLYAYIGGIIRNYESHAYAINGTTDHTHVLVQQSKNIATPTLVREIKKGSSRWVNTHADIRQRFAWQEGYAAFSICDKEVESVRRYILNQKAHHRTETFQAEYIRLLEERAMEYDERYLWT